MDTKLRNSYQMRLDMNELEERFTALMSQKQRGIFFNLISLRNALEAFDNGQLTEQGLKRFEDTLVLVRKDLPAGPDLIKLLRRGKWLKITGIVLFVTSVSCAVATAASLFFIIISALLGHWSNTNMIPGLLGLAAGAGGIYYLWTIWLRAKRSDIS